MQYYDPNHFYFNKDCIQVLGAKEGFLEVLKDMIYIIPKDILDGVLSNCAFLMLNNTERVAAAFIPKKLIEEKSIFAFYDILYSQDKDEQKRMILHEIAHYVLDHIDEGLSDEDNDKQEEEANNLSDMWLNDWKADFNKIEEEAIKPWKGDD